MTFRRLLHEAKLEMLGDVRVPETVTGTGIDYATGATAAVSVSPAANRHLVPSEEKNVIGNGHETIAMVPVAVVQTAMVPAAYLHHVLALVKGILESEGIPTAESVSAMMGVDLTPLATVGVTPYVGVGRSRQASEHLEGRRVELLRRLQE